MAAGGGDAATEAARLAVEAARVEAEAVRAAKRRKKAAFDDAYDTGGAKGVDREVATGDAAEGSGSEDEEEKGGEEGRTKKRGMGWARYVLVPACCVVNVHCWHTRWEAVKKFTLKNLDMHLITMMPQCARLPSLPRGVACTVCILRRVVMWALP